MTAFVALVMAATACPCQAGGLLTNTNQNVAFLRNPARDGVIAIDGVYSNPAGVAFLPNGLHISLNNQSAFQTRIINSGMSVPGLEGTPYYHPLSMNGGDENGVKQYKGEASAPIVPSFQVAWNHDKWGFQMGFALVGGGGKCTFNEGLGSFERQIALLPAVMQQTNQLYQQQYGIDLGLGTDTPGYSVESYMHGQQYIFGLQLGATYKLNEHLAVYGGFRFNYILNKYKGSIQNISVNVGGAMENLHQFLGNKAAGLTEQAAQYQTQATTYAAMAEEAMAQGNTQLAQQLGEAAQQLTQAAQLAQGGAQAMESTQEQVGDKRLECTQRGWAIAPIIGIDWKWEKLNIGARYEFPSQCNIQNDTKVDDTGLFADGVNTPGDIPALFTIGAQYELLSNLRLMAGYHLFFDKDADMADEKQKKLGGNTWEVNAGAEYDITDAITVSAGMQRTKYDLADGGYLTDMSFVTSSYSIGLGACVKVAKNIKVNVAYFWTNYETFDKAYEQEYSMGGQTITAHNTDSFTRTNKVFGVGVDFTL